MQINRRDQWIAKFNWVMVRNNNFIFYNKLMIKKYYIPIQLWEWDAIKRNLNKFEIKTNIVALKSNSKLKT